MTDCSTNADGDLEGNVLERLLTASEDIFEEIQFSRNENQNIRAQLAEVIAKNDSEKCHQSPFSDTLESFKREYIDVSDRIFNNLKVQLNLVHQEKELYEKLWIKTASALESRIDHPMMKLNVSLKQQIVSLESDCQKQKEMNKVLNIHVKTVMQVLEKTKKEQKLFEEKLRNSQQMEARKDDKYLEEKDGLNQEQLKTSMVSFQKLQEVIKVTEDAVAEVETLTMEKRQLEEECNFLAQTISSVIEEASASINKDFESLKATTQNEKLRYEREHLEAVKSLTFEREMNLAASQQAALLDEELKNLRLKNILLSKSLEKAKENSKHQWEEELEMKNKEINNLKVNVRNQRKSKRKWKLLVVHITQTLQEKIKQLILENSRPHSRAKVPKWKRSLECKDK